MKQAEVPSEKPLLRDATRLIIHSGDGRGGSDASVSAPFGLDYREIRGAYDLPSAGAVVNGKMLGIVFRACSTHHVSKSYTLAAPPAP